MLVQTLNPTAPTTPRFQDLAHIFERLIGYWSQPRVEYLWPVADTAVNLPIERTIRWSGQFQGTLVIRCSHDFQFWLKSKFRGNPLDPIEDGEILDQVLSTYCLQLVERFGGREIFRMGPLLSQTSRSSDWPAETPSSTCALKVDGCLLEIRLWVDGTR